MNLKLTFLLLTFTFLVSCNSTDENTTQLKAEESVEAPTSEFSIKKAPCDFISSDEVAKILGFEKEQVTSKSGRDKDDYKICRYEIRVDNNHQFALNLNIRYNDRQDVRPNQYSDRLKEALNQGLTAAGFKDMVQTFKPINNLGSEAGYSENIDFNKNLIIRIDEDYLINLEFSHYGIPQENIESKLVDIAKRTLK